MMTNQTHHAPVPTSGDAELVSQSLTGNREAFGLVVTRYQSLICSLTYSATGSLSQSEDLAQETFVAAWKQLGELREPAKLRAWICGIARNLIHNARRRDQREPSHKAEALDRAPEPRSTEATPSDQAVSKEEAAILWRALERLPENYREPLVLFYREHQSVERVAEALDLNEDVVRQRLSRGRKLLEAEVAAFLAGALERSAPGPAFTMGVLGVLPVLTTTAKVAAAGTLAAKSGVIAKLAALAASAEAFVPLVAQVLLALVGRRGNRETLEHLQRTMPAKDWARFDAYQRELKRRGRICMAALIVAEVALGFWEIVIEECSSILVYLGVSNGLLAAFFAALYFSRRPLKRRYAAAKEEQGKARRSLPLQTSEFRSKLTLLGLPFVHVVRDRSQGTVAERSAPVKAWIAIASPLHPIPAYGLIFAFGRRAFAPVSVGALAVGLVPIGACSAGLLAMGGLAVGGWAAGIVALGRMAAGILSAGWIGAAGIWAFAHDFGWGAAAFAAHVDDNLAREFFDRSNFFSMVHAAAEFGHVVMLMAVLVPLWWDHRARQIRNRAAALLQETSR